MSTRREFLGHLAAPAAAPILFALPAASLAGVLREIAATPGSAAALADDEDFWAMVSQAFTIDRSVINFNNGGVSPAPAIVQDAMKRHLDFANSMPPPRALWTVQQPQVEGVRAQLAREFGADAEEIAITRNASESLQICQFGLGLMPGDEILTTTHDYPRMLTTFRQRERREGVVVRTVKLPIPCEDDALAVDLFRRSITPRTRMILMCHIVNITGQILPVREIVAMAREHNGGIPVIVDGAHALAHFDFQLRDLECDYYGVSLHKWLFAPHGTGLLYVRRDKIRDLWPLMAAPEVLDDDIRKFEEIGTHPVANCLAIAEAITFHQAIGAARKEARLRFLRDAWAKRLLAHHRVRLHTSLKPQFACGVATVQIEGIDSSRLMNWLWETHKILVTAIKHDEFEGIRITPSVYTTMNEIERFCDAMEWVIDHGLPE